MPYSDDLLRQVLTDTKVIALVGWSPRADRPSHGVARYLAARGYTVIPVNPGQAGVVTEWGQVVQASLSDIAGPVDMVDIFRASDAVGPVVDEAAAARATAAGVQVIMNRCPAIEIPRLIG